jgi:hypothetical protein
MSLNREGLDASVRCRATERFSEDWNCPVDQDGKPYRIGYRICKHFDCIEPKHITQSRYIAKKIYGYVPKIHRGRKSVPVDDALLKKIARPVDKFNPPKTCQVPGCKEKHRGLHLCNRHHGQLYRLRLKDGKPKRMKRDNSDIARYIKPAVWSELTIKDRHCHYPDCDIPYFARGLCKVHHKRWLRWKAETNVR